MADKVRATVEKFIPDLLTLQKREIFSYEDIQGILKEREDNEYLLQRKNVRLKDFLKVLEYEYTLERRRVENKKILKLKKSSDSDFTIIKRIIFIWDKIMNKYRYNIGLWKQYLAFCYQIKSKKQFNKAVTHALSLNPYEIDLWLLAAYYEFEVNSNPFKARKVFYKALKIVQDSRIWCEYIRFELKFLELVKKREDYLSQTIKNKPDNDNGFLSFKQSDLIEVEEEEEQVQDKFHDYDFISSIIKIAQKKFNNDDFLQNIINILDENNFDDNILKIKNELNINNDVQPQIKKFKATINLQTKNIYSKIDNLPQIRKIFQRMTKNEICDLLSSLLKSELALTDLQEENIYKIGKEYLLTQKQLFSDFLDGYFTRFHNQLKIKLKEIIQLNQYCPIQYQLVNVKEQPLNKQFLYLQKLLLWYGDKIESWQHIFKWSSINCPEKAKDILELQNLHLSINCRGLREKKVESNMLIDIFNMSFRN